MGKIVIIGSANTDMVVKSERLPVPGETILGGRFLMNPGGKGANQAVAAARMGGEVIFIAKVGNDLFGREAIAAWQKEKIDTRYVTIDPENSTGAALIMVDSKGENCISVASGANGTLSPADLLPARDIIESADIVLMQLETPLETVRTAAQWAEEKGIRVILNPAPAAKLPDELLASLFLITPNESEAEILTGVRVNDENSARHVCAELHQRGVANVIITMGRRGAYLSCGAFREIVPAYPVKAVDTTAAGDIFNGALAMALAEGQNWSSAVRLAARAAALSVTRSGAQRSAPLRSEVAAFS